MHSLSEVAALLGCRDPRRITKCMQIAGIDPETLPQPPQDKRVRLLSEAQVEQIRTAYAHLYGPKQPTDTSALAARVAALEATIEQLRQRAPYLFESRHTDHLATVERLPPVYAPSHRPTATTVRHKHTPARPPVPSHLMSLPTWADVHDVKISTMKTWRENGKLPVVRDQWMEEGRGRIDTALTIEGREVAHQLAHLPWPCERCMLEETEEENETTSTLAVVEVVPGDPLGGRD